MRVLNTAAQSLLARLQGGEQIPVVQLVELLFAVPERYCTAGVTVAWAGSQWKGIGLQIEAVESDVTNMPSLTLALPAVSEAQISLALTQPIEGTTLRLYDALLDPQTGEVADAVLAWSGALNMPGVEDGPQAVINVLAEHRGVLAIRSKVSRYTDDEQQRLYPGDTSLKFDPATDTAPLAWPAAGFFRQ